MFSLDTQIRHAEDTIAAWRALDTKERYTQTCDAIANLVIKPADLHRSGDAQHRLIFNHVPKTGGESVEKFCMQHVRINDALHINMPNLVANPAAYARTPHAPRVIMGHHPLHSPLYLLQQQPYVHLIVIREPAARVESWYRYVWQKADHPWHDAVKNQTPEQFLQDTRFTEQQNAQSRRLLGVLHDAEHQLSESDAHKAQRALENLFSIVSVTDALEALATYLCNVFDWPESAMPRENTNQDSDAPRFSASEQEICRGLNRCDLALYQHAKRLWQQQISGQ